MKKVLVLMSTYNGEKYLGNQLDSLLLQKGVEVTIRIRDDGSKDRTRNIVKNYQRNNSNIELIEGDNLGFAQSFLSLIYSVDNPSQYDYYAFSDQDDVWMDDKLLSAVTMLEECPTENSPVLYFSNALAVDEALHPLFKTTSDDPLISKATCLVRYFMLGCTMLFNPSVIEYLKKYRPEGRITMHDLWLNQTCVFLGQVLYDKTPHILYRQHDNNTAGVGSSWSIRWKRLMKSFRSYERRHFREINAKNLLSAYGSILSKEDYELISLVANYKSSVYSRLRLFFSKKINMGSFISDVAIRIRILLGLF